MERSNSIQNCGRFRLLPDNLSINTFTACSLQGCQLFKLPSRIPVK